MIQLVQPGYRTICPFCQEHFHPAEAPLRPNRLALRPSEPVEREPDHAISAFLGPGAEPPVLTRLQHPTWRWWNHVLIHTPRGLRGHKVCPSCHLPVPSAATNGELKPRTLAIVGARDSGKSNYFGVLIRELQTRFCKALRFSMMGLDTWSVSRQSVIGSDLLYRERYGRRLFEEQMAMEPTLTAEQYPEVRVPLIYRFRFERKKVLDLAIFDAAGEDIESGENSHLFNRYVTNACGIICLLDPEGFPGFRDRAGPTTPAANSAGYSPLSVMTSIVNLFAQEGLRIKRRIDVPIAIAFSKSDLFRGYIPAHSPLLRDSRHPGGFEEWDSIAVHKELYTLAERWGYPGVVNTVEQTFSRFRLFGFSALGRSPGPDKKLNFITPLRVADPLLWLFAELGYIRKIV